ncbi:glycosyltransferase [Schumannella sp. 10F1B-5-1]|uniref:glycosyltransferase n=1 Tax=Schumannella sp. 10F1B-5-1 TaxID=2590780 RepID=UPI001131ABF8|nr:glycosyltransferase [Schumannella sp. 10F1B-5-1]TPW70824.1 glycosyltransferase family 4 protein [Schumannella sp. 10F1B-5-1]
MTDGTTAHSDSTAPDGSTGGAAARRPLRVIVGADTFPPDINGSATFARQLAAGLKRRGHDVHVFAPSPDNGWGLRQEEHGGVTLPVHRLLSWRWFPHPWLRFALPWRVLANARRVIAEVQPDVVHFQSHIVVGRGLAPAAREKGIRLVGTNHTMPENITQHVHFLPPPMLRWLVRLQWASAGKWFGLADAVTAPTQRSADYFDKHTGLHDTVAISNGIALSKYTADLGPRDENLIVFLGRLDDEKKIDELVKAVAKLDPALDAKAVIMGDGDQKAKLAALIQELGLQDRVRLAGKVSYDELRATLTRAKVFAMPSVAELQSITTLEAMASGQPIVAANAMALPHLVDEGVNGYLFEPGDIDGFAARLTDVLTAPEEKLRAMREASLRLSAVHDVEHTLDIFEALYRGEPLPPAPEPRTA